MRRATTTGKGRRNGTLLAVAVLLVAGPAAAGAGGGGEPARSAQEAREPAWAEARERVRALFDPGAGGSSVGVTVRDVEDGAAPAAAEEGALVTEVADGAPAAAAGIEAGDVVVEFDGERVRSVRQLTRIVRETPAGRAVPATVLRAGARITLTVTPAERPRPAWTTRLPRVEVAGPGASFAWRGHPSALDELPDFVDRAFRSVAGRARLGIRGESIDGQLAGYFGVAAGVLVRHVGEETVAAAAGLRAGDVITAIDGEAVDDLGALRRRLSALDPGASFAVAVMRDGAETSLPAELEEDEPEEDEPEEDGRRTPSVRRGNSI